MIGDNETQEKNWVGDKAEQRGHQNIIGGMRTID